MPKACIQERPSKLHVEHLMGEIFECYVFCHGNLKRFFLRFFK